MTTRKTLKAAALAGVCMLPLIAVANAQELGAVPSVGTSAPVTQPSLDTGSFDNEVTVGVGGISGVSPGNEHTAPFSKYNGLSNSGAGVFGNFNLNARDAWNSGNTHYFSFTGENLNWTPSSDNPNVNIGASGLAPEAALNFKVGDQGKWGVNAFYNAMTYTGSNNFTTILDSAGNLSPGLQAALINDGAYINHVVPTGTGFYTTAGRANAAFAGPALGSTNEYTDVVGTRRDLFGIGGKYQLGNWLLTAQVSDEHKQGSLEDAMTTGGSNTGMIAFALPIDFDTENYRVDAAYSTQKLQAKVYYNLSNFIDHNAGGYAFQGWNTATVANGGGAYTAYSLSGVYAETPNNQAHTVGSEFGYNLTPTTRFNASAVYSLQLQNDALPAATQNAYVLGTPTLAHELASNPTSLSGLVHTFFGSAAVTSEPLPKLNLRAAYNVDLRAPEMSTQSIWGDATDSTSLKNRIVAPEGWTKQNVVLEAGYKVLPSTRVTVGYAYRDADRTNAITARTADNEGSIKVNSTITPNLQGSLGYLHADRTASTPNFAMWNSQIVSDCFSAASGALGCQQVPFYEQARTEDSVTGNLMGTIAPNLTSGLFGKFTNNQYHPDEASLLSVNFPGVGLDKSYSIQGGPTLNYQYTKATEAHVFYTFMRNYQNMRALSVNGTVPGQYSEATTYDLHSAGVGGTWRATDKLKFGADYIFSYGAQAFNQNGIWNLGEGAGVVGDPQLNTSSTNNQVKIHATYDVTAATQLYLAYEYDQLDMSDYALVGATAGQVLTGDVPAVYNVHTIMAAVKVKW